MNRRIAAFLLPRSLEGFILADLVRPLAEAPDVMVIEPGLIPPGSSLRIPAWAAGGLAGLAARRTRFDAQPAALIVMHPVLWPSAKALLERNPDAQLWYGIWDRYDQAPGASPATRLKIAELHEAVSSRADWRFAVSGALAEIERGVGRETSVIPPPHDSFPAPDPARQIIAASMGHLGRRTDWALLRSLLEGVPELTLLLIGSVHEGESPGDPDMAAVLGSPRVIALGRLSDESAARMIGMADVCILPFRQDPFNDAGLPQRILKAARQGRRTLSPPLAGPRTEDRAVTICDSIDEWAAQLRASASQADRSGDVALRQWALSMDEATRLEPIRAQLRELGVRAD